MYAKVIDIVPFKPRTGRSRNLTAFSGHLNGSVLYAHPRQVGEAQKRTGDHVTAGRGFLDNRTAPRDRWTGALSARQPDAAVVPRVAIAGRTTPTAVAPPQFPPAPCRAAQLKSTDKLYVRYMKGAQVS